MLIKKTFILSCVLLISHTCTYSIAASYTTKDKKKFADLVDVSFTKSSLATKARKTERIKDLQQLAALMIQRLAGTINGAEFYEEGQEEPGIQSLKEEYKTADVLAKFAQDIKAGSTKPDLLAATRFATHDFEATFEAEMEKIFQKNLKEYESSDMPAAFKDLLQKTKKELAKNKQPFTLLNFEFYNINKNTRSNLKEEEKELLAIITRTLHPDKEQIIAKLDIALRQFNVQYKQVIAAIKEIDKKTAESLPAIMTLGYLKRGAIK